MLVVIIREELDSGDYQKVKCVRKGFRPSRGGPDFSPQYSTPTSSVPDPSCFTGQSSIVDVFSRTGPHTRSVRFGTGKHEERVCPLDLEQKRYSFLKSRKSDVSSETGKSGRSF